VVRWHLLQHTKSTYRPCCRHVVSQVSVIFSASFNFLCQYIVTNMSGGKSRSGSCRMVDKDIPVTTCPREALSQMISARSKLCTYKYHYLLISSSHDMSEVKYLQHLSYFNNCTASQTPIFNVNRRNLSWCNGLLRLIEIDANAIVVTKLIS